MIQAAWPSFWLASANAANTAPPRTILARVSRLHSVMLQSAFPALAPGLHDLMATRGIVSEHLVEIAQRSDDVGGGGHFDNANQNICLRPRN